MTRYGPPLLAGVLLGVLIPAVTGLLLIEFTDIAEKEFRHA